MERAIATVCLLIGSNVFMTWAWYGHLKKTGWTIPVAIAVSWLIALPEYLLQVPANRIGHVGQGGPFSAAQLKVIQEAITLCVFMVFAVLVLRERLRANELVAFGLIFAAVVVAMAGRGGAETGVIAPPSAPAGVPPRDVSGDGSVQSASPRGG